MAFIRGNAIQPRRKGQAAEVESGQVQQGLEEDLGGDVGSGGLISYPAQDEKEDSFVIFLV